MTELAAFLEACAQVLDPAGILRGDRARYEVDFWHQYAGRAAAVLRPKSRDEVSRILALAHRHRVPIVPQAGNTGLAAGGIPDPSGRMVVLSLERMDRIRAVDPAGEWLIAEAGCVLADVQRCAEDMKRLFPLSLGAEGSCRIGGNLSTNAGGVNVLRYGMARRLVLGLEVVLCDGTVLDRLRVLEKDNRGPALEQLFIGAEGILGVITAAALRLFPLPRRRLTLWLGVPDAAAALAVFRAFRERFGELLSMFEIQSDAGLELVVRELDRRRPIAASVPWHLLVELAWSFDADLDEPVLALVAELQEVGLVADGALAASEVQRRDFLALREQQSEAAARVGEVVRSDVGVPVAAVPELLARAVELAARRFPEALPIPFGHLGDGNIHLNYVVPRGRIEAARAALVDAVAELAISLGGTFSAEHGIGRIRRELFRRFARSGELEVLAAVKRLFDRRGILNPGAVLPDGIEPWDPEAAQGEAAFACPAGRGDGALQNPREEERP